MLDKGAEQERIEVLLRETVTLLCKNGVQFVRGLQIQGLIGVTVDDDRVFLVNINESVSTDDMDQLFGSESGFSQPSHPSHANSSHTNSGHASASHANLSSAESSREGARSHDKKLFYMSSITKSKHLVKAKNEGNSGGSNLNFNEACFAESERDSEENRYDGDGGGMFSERREFNNATLIGNANKFDDPIVIKEEELGNCAAFKRPHNTHHKTHHESVAAVTFDDDCILDDLLMPSLPHQEYAALPSLSQLHPASCGLGGGPDSDFIGRRMRGPPRRRENRMSRPPSAWKNFRRVNRPRFVGHSSSVVDSGDAACRVVTTSVHVCAHADCGKQFRHRRHLLRHQTHKHGRVPTKVFDGNRNTWVGFHGGGVETDGSIAWE